MQNMNKQKSLSSSGIFYFNCQSLPKNIEQFRSFCQLYNPKMLLLSETHVTSDLPENLEIKGYILISCDSRSRRTGGTAIYLHKNFEENYKFVFKKDEDNFWCLVIRLKDIPISGTFAIVYKSPKETKTNFLNFMKEVIKHIDKKNDILIVGDMNINIAGMQTRSVTEYLESFEALNLTQLVKEITRKHNDSGTLIDHVWTNNKRKFSCFVHKEPKIGDHFMIEIKCNISYEEKPLLPFLVKKEHEKYYSEPITEYKSIQYTTQNEGKCKGITKDKRQCKNSNKCPHHKAANQG